MNSSNPLGHVICPLRQGYFSTLYIDHKTLATLHMQSQLRKRRARWIVKFKSYQFHVKYFLGKENHMINYLSKYLIRNPLQMLEENIRMLKFVEIALYTKK